MSEDENEETAPLSARLPADLVDFVKVRAKRNGRSITQELAQMLMDARTFEDMIAKARYERDYKRAS